MLWIILLVFVGWIIYWCTKSKIFAKIIIFLVYTFWIFCLGWFLFLLLVDFNELLAIGLAWIVTVFWVIWSIAMFKNKSNDIKTSGKIENIIFEIKESHNFLVNKKIENLNVWDKKAVIFLFHDGKKIKIVSINLLKISMKIVEQFWKNIFEKWELRKTYNFIKDNYKSDLNNSDYEQIINIIERFVNEWWEIQII